MYLKYAVIFIYLMISNVAAQQVSNEWGGVTDIFEYPVGARAMSMGGAHVSVVDDPFALYWNPAALDTVPSVGLGFYHTNLPGATQYNYVAFVLPTLRIGTFSAGLLRLATPQIEVRETDASLVGHSDYGRYLYLLGYGKRISRWAMAGATLKIERINMPGYADGLGGMDDAFSESGIGGDFGLLITPPMQYGLLSGWALGLNWQNFVQRAMQFEEERERSSRLLRLGVSRTVPLADGRDQLIIATEMDWSDAPNVPTYIHVGGEYSLADRIMFRLGWNKRGESENAGITWGLGVNYLGFQVDYSYWNGVDSFFGGGHRISASVGIGKTRSERRADLQAVRMRQIQEEAERSRALERQKAIDEGFAEAQDFYSNGDYARAYRAIMQVLSFAKGPDDPEFKDARDLEQMIEAARQRKFEAQLANQAERNQVRQDSLRRQQQIKEFYDNAFAFFEAGDYKRAIQECERALELDSQDPQTRSLMRDCEQELKQQIEDFMMRAKRLASESRYYEALNLYTSAQDLADGFDDRSASQIEGEINRLRSALTFEDKILQARQHELDDNWAKAAQLYEEALRVQPNNQTLKQKHLEAQARANAKYMKMTPEVNALYIKGYRAVREKRFDEGIEYYKQALELQPLNITILNALDYARDQKARQAGNGSD